MLKDSVAFQKVLSDNLSLFEKYRMKIDNIENYNLKSFLKQNPVKSANCVRDTFEIEFYIDDFYKIMLSEMELFLGKAVLQNLESRKKNWSSYNWKFVTYYYMTFFYCTSLMRMLCKGCTYVDAEFKDFLNSYYTINIPKGNYYYSVSSKSDTSITVLFQKTSGTVHEETWIILFEKILPELLLSATERDEIKFLRRISTISGTLTSQFPSTARNFYNYNPASILKDFDKELSIEISNDDFFKKIQQEENIGIDIKNKARYTLYLSKIMSCIVRNLYENYQNRLRIKTDVYKEIRKIESKQKLTKADLFIET